MNPITTLADAWEDSEEGRSQRRARNVVERTLGIRRIFDDYDLYASDRWFDGDRFLRWTLEQGSVGAGARALVDHIDETSFDRRVFRDSDEGGPNARVAAIPGADAASILDGLIDAANSAANLSGPQGFLLGTALLFIKKGIDAGLNPSKETNSAEKESPGEARRDHSGDIGPQGSGRHAVLRVAGDGDREDDHSDQGRAEEPHGRGEA